MHVRVNAAMSADGKLATRRREQLRISGDEDFARVDRLRAASDAILVGVGTVLADDPSLIRHDEQSRNKSGVPARVVADSLGRTPLDAEVLAGAPPTYMLVSEAAQTDRRVAFRDHGAEVVVAGEDRVNLRTAFEKLESRGVDDLLVEGGGELVFSLFKTELVDELSVYISNLIIGGREAPTLVDGEGFVDEFPELILSDTTQLDEGIVLFWDVG